MQKIYKSSRHSPSVIISPDRLSLSVTLDDVNVSWKEGILGAERSEVIPYRKIEAVNVNQGPLQKSLNYGNVIISSADDDDPIVLSDIENPFELRDDIVSMMETTSAPNPPVAVEPPGGSVAATVEDELEKLAKLRDEGVVTPQEFDSRKRQLLGE